MYITYIILIGTVLISLKAIDNPELKYRFLLNPYDVVNEKKWYRIFSHGFIHADYIHLFFNMFVLYMFGVEHTDSDGSFMSLEPALVHEFGGKGYWVYFLLYFGGIAFSSLYSLIKYKDNPNYNSLGASGAVYAVVFASIIVNPEMQMGILFLPFYLPAYIFGPLLLLIEYFMSKRGSSKIAHDAHISGAIFGIIFISVIHVDFFYNFIKAILN